MVFHRAALGQVGHNRISIQRNFRLEEPRGNAFLYYPGKKVYVAIWIGSRHKDLYNGVQLTQSLHNVYKNTHKDVHN